MDIIDRVFEKYGIKNVAKALIVISIISIIIIAILIYKTIADANEFQKKEINNRNTIQDIEVPAFKEFNETINERFRRSH